MAREGQERVEVRPGVFLWLNEADRKALGPRPAPVRPAPETAAVAAPETTAQPRAAVRRPKGR